MRLLDASIAAAIGAFDLGQLQSALQRAPPAALQFQDDAGGLLHVVLKEAGERELEFALACASCASALVEFVFARLAAQRVFSGDQRCVCEPVAFC